MVRPRIFVSSTYYDLKHIRSSLENFIESMGFEAILSEKGNIAFSPEIPLDESCFREVENSDIFVIIIGGRYGSERSGGKEQTKQFYDRYESITKKEYLIAVKKNIPTYILVERSVYVDYETFLKNKANESVNYAHVESANIFYLIEEILSQPKNNPVHQFDRYNDIEAWLTEQWAGLFRELINQRSKQTQITSLVSQVSLLAEINETLKRYMEEIMSKVSPESLELISNESKRLESIKQDKELEKNMIYGFLISYGILMDDLKNALVISKSVEDFIEKVVKKADPDSTYKLREILREEWIVDINEARKILGLDPLILSSTVP